MMSNLTVSDLSYLKSMIFLTILFHLKRCKITGISLYNQAKEYFPFFSLLFLLFYCRFFHVFLLHFVLKLAYYLNYQKKISTLVSLPLSSLIITFTKRIYFSFSLFELIQEIIAL